MKLCSQKEIKLKNNDFRLAKIRHLLFADELEQLNALASKLEKLEFESHDEENIRHKIEPLFDDILLQRLQNKEKKTIEVLSRYLASIISKSSEIDIDSLSRSLQHVISPAIEKEISNNKEKMIDALYPIMGGMISKYVRNAISEIAENINRKIEDGFSFRRYKRKLKAKITGLSETELLLKESIDTGIRSLLVIQKDTGLLIAEVGWENSEINDPHIVASMASAVKDFVNDWINSSKENMIKEVQLLSYGDATLYIESAGSVYLIAFLDTEPDHECRRRINAFFGDLVKQYGNFFQSFEGNDEAKEIENTETMMQSFIRNENSIHIGKNKRNSYPLKYIAILLLLLLAGYGWMKVQRYLEMNKLENMITDITGEHIDAVTIGSDIRLNGNLNSPDSYRTILRLAKRKTKGDIIDEISLSAKAGDEIFKKEKKRLESFRTEQSDNITLAEKRIMQILERRLAAENSRSELKNRDLSKHISLIGMELKKLQKDLKALKEKDDLTKSRLQNLKKSIGIKNEIIERLHKIFASDPVFNANDGSLEFKNALLFKTGRSTPQKNSIEIVEQYAEQYIRVLAGSDTKPFLKQIVIEGYTDSSGAAEYNKNLSQERARQIKNRLLELPVVEEKNLQNLFKAVGLADSNPVIIDGKEDKKASRRIKIRFEIDTDKLLQSMEKEFL